MRSNKTLDQNIFLLLPTGGRSCLGTERALLRKPDFLIQVCESDFRSVRIVKTKVQRLQTGFICCQSETEFPATEAKSRATRSFEVLVLAKAPMRGCRTVESGPGRQIPTPLPLENLNAISGAHEVPKLGQHQNWMAERTSLPALLLRVL
jgi:hypothetical protein